jgi:hypothetical protein
MCVERPIVYVVDRDPKSLRVLLDDLARRFQRLRSGGRQFS